MNQQDKFLLHGDQYHEGETPGGWTGRGGLRSEKTLEGRSVDCGDASSASFMGKWSQPCSSESEPMNEAFECRTCQSLQRTDMSHALNSGR